MISFTKKLLKSGEFQAKRRPGIAS